MPQSWDDTTVKSTKMPSKRYYVITIHAYCSHANFDNAIEPLQINLHASLLFVGAP